MSYGLVKSFVTRMPTWVLFLTLGPLHASTSYDVCRMCDAGGRCTVFGADSDLPNFIRFLLSPGGKACEVYCKNLK